MAQTRAYRPDDLVELAALFRETVLAVGVGFYRRDELEAWAPGDLDPADWAPRLARNRVLVAEQAGTILGFAELTPEGVVDMLYVHKDHQGRGVAGALLAELETAAREAGLARLTTDASRIARALFERRGFSVLAAQRVERKGLLIENFRMEKVLAS